MRRVERLLAACLVTPYFAVGCYGDDVLAVKAEPAGIDGQSCAGVSIESGASDCMLPAPSGPVVCVIPEQAALLPDLVAAAAAGTTLVLAPGTYGAVSGAPLAALTFDAPGVTLRSASGNAADVVLDGQYLTEAMIRIRASDVMIAGVTLRHALHHAIHVTPAGGSIEGIVLSGLHIIDAGNRLVKVDGGLGSYVDRGMLNCSTLELTAQGRERIQPSDTACDTGGLFAIQTRGWSVQGNSFRGLYCSSGGVASHAIQFSDGSRDSLIERNVIEECARGIGLGSQGVDPLRQYDDDPYPGLAPIAHYGGIVRNNVIAATVPQFDTGIELMQARGARVLHNSILHPEAAFSSIDYRFANTAVNLSNNLVVRTTSRDQGQAEEAGNLAGATAELFVAASQGDLHLAPSAAMAIDQGVVLPDAGSDIDGFSHDVGLPDVGADELGAP